MMTKRTATTASQRLNRRELRRVAMWGLSTAGALLIAALVASSETGWERLTVATAKIRGDIVARPAPLEDNTRKVTEALQLLAVDRDRLAARLDALEHNLSEVTGAIERLPVAAVPVAPLASSAPVPAQPTPLPSAPRVTAPEVTSAAPLQVPAAPPELAQEFGIDLGSAVNSDGLRVLWAAAKSKHGGLLEGLYPIAAIRQAARFGRRELRLVVGPIPSATAAARLCSLIAASGTICQAAAFEGQRLAVR